MTQRTPTSRTLKNCCAAHLLRCGPPGVLTYRHVRSARQAPPRLASGLARDVFQQPLAQLAEKKPSASRSPHDLPPPPTCRWRHRATCFALDGASNRLQPGCQSQKMGTRRACALLKIGSQTFLSEREDGSSSREDCRL